jgi:hypothetical protein
MRHFASGVISGVGSVTCDAHVIQGDNTIAMTAVTGAVDQPGWHVGQELWLTVRPAISQVMRRFADTIWDHAGLIWNHAVLWAAAVKGWIATAMGWVGIERDDVWQAVYKKAVAIIMWFSNRF